MPNSDVVTATSNVVNFVVHKSTTFNILNFISLLKRSTFVLMKLPHVKRASQSYHEEIKIKKYILETSSQY